MELSIKLLGATAIILCGFLVAKHIVDRGGRQKTLLTEVVDLLTFINNNFYYRRSNVTDIFKEAQKIERTCLDLEFDNLNNKEYEKELIYRISQSDGLNRLMSARQREMFIKALKNIGVGSLEEECSRLEYYINYFKEEYAILAERDRKNRRVCLGMCIYASVVVTVILL